MLFLNFALHVFAPHVLKCCFLKFHYMFLHGLHTLNDLYCFITNNLIKFQYDQDFGYYTISKFSFTLLLLYTLTVTFINKKYTLKINFVNCQPTKILHIRSQNVN